MIGVTKLWLSRLVNDTGDRYSQQNTTAYSITATEACIVPHATEKSNKVLCRAI